VNEVQTPQSLFKIDTITCANSGGKRDATRVSKTLKKTATQQMLEN